MIVLFIHFFLGLLIFSGVKCAKFFSPIIFAIVSLVRKMINSCGCCCREEWKIAINEMLDDALKVECKNQIGVEALEGLATIASINLASFSTQSSDFQMV